MKGKKKLLLLALALSMVTTSAFAFTACDDGSDPGENPEIEDPNTPKDPEDPETPGTHKHSWSEWETETAPTCTTEGVKIRYCTAEDCDESETGEIAIDPNAHRYSTDWHIDVPTEDAAGSAYKLCDYNSTHRQNVTLPALSNQSAYKSVETDGIVSRCVFNANGEDITFNAYDFSNVTVAQAVSLAFANNSKIFSSVITSTSTDYDKLGQSSSDGRQLGQSSVNIDLEFGFNYLHIVDRTEGVKETWYERLDNGEIFAVLKFIDRLGVESIKRDTDSRVENIFDNGYGFYITWDMHNHWDYGAGAFISYCYAWGMNNNENDFVESVETRNGKKVYKFTFSHYDPTYYSPEVGDDHLNFFSFEFTLDKNGVVDWADISNTTYANRIGATMGGNTTTTRTDFVNTPNGWRLVEKNELNATPQAKHKQQWTVTQRSVLGDGEQLPTMPYKYEDLLATSFDLEQVRVDADFKITSVIGPLAEEVTVNPTQGITIHIANIQPADKANLYIDEPQFFLRTVDEYGETVDTPIVSGGMGKNDGTVVGSYSPERFVIVLNPYVAGDLTLVIKTVKVEKVVVMHVPYAAPTEWDGSNAFSYDVLQKNEETLFDAEVESKYDHLNTVFHIYEGQELAFKSKVPHPAYQESRYTVSVSTDIENGYTLGTTNWKGDALTTFKASKAGVYTVTLTSAYSSSIQSTFEVRVAEAPTENELLGGVAYRGVDKNNNLITAAFDTNAQTVTVKFGVKDDGSFDEESVFSYAYTAATANSPAGIDVTYVSGAQTYEFEFEVTDGYNLYLVFVSSVGTKSYVYMYQNVKNQIVGNYALKSNNHPDQVTHTVNIAGTYYLEVKDVPVLDGVYAFWYSVNSIVKRVDCTVKDGVGYASVKLNLEEDDELLVYHPSAKGTYTISLFNNVESITLDQTTAQITVGQGALHLTATVGPDNASVKDVTWTSSDPSIATVNENGVVTGLKAGTVTITAISTQNSDAYATCTVTVTFNDVTELSVAPVGTTTSLKVGSTETVKLQATANSDASNKAVTWTSSDNSIATVTTTGGVVTLNPNRKTAGTVTITATSVSNPSVKATYVVQVVFVNATGISLDKTEAEVSGGTLQLTATVTPADASDKTVNWTSSDTDVATVDANGLVTINPNISGAGTVTITAASASNPAVTATCVITVTYGAPVSITVAEQEVNVSLSKTAQVHVTLKDANNETPSNTTLVYTYSEDGVVTVDQNGNVTVNPELRRAAAVTVTVKPVANDEISATFTVNVAYVPVTEFALQNEDDSAVTLTYGTYKNIKFVVTGADDKAPTLDGIDWSCDNESAIEYAYNSTTKNLSVSIKDGFKQSATVVLTGTSRDNPELTVQITLTFNYVAVQSVSFATTSKEFKLGIDTETSFTLTPVFNPTDASNKNVTWKSSNTGVSVAGGTVSINSSKFTTSTTVTITATSSDNSAAVATFTLNIVVVNIESIEAAQEELTLHAGENFFLESLVTVLPEKNSDSLTVTFSEEGFFTTDDIGSGTYYKATATGTVQLTFASKANSAVSKTITITIVRAQLEYDATKDVNEYTVYLTPNTGAPYTFIGEAGKNYTFTVPNAAKTQEGEFVNYLGTTSFSATAGNDGKIKFAVGTNYNFEGTSLTLTVKENKIADIKGDGTADNPFEIELEMTVPITGLEAGYTKNYQFAVLTIEEDGDYYWERTNNMLVIYFFTNADEVATGATSGKPVFNTYTTSTNPQALTAGTYYIRIHNNGFTTLTDVNFTLHKV